MNMESPTKSETGNENFIYYGGSHHNGNSIGRVLSSYSASYAANDESSYSAYSSSSTDDHDSESAHESEGHFAMPHMVFVLFILIAAPLVRFLISSLSTRRYKPPFTVIMGVIGVACGALNEFLDSGGLWATSVRYWSKIHPQFILFVLLPPLLFESAFSMKWHVFRKQGLAAIVLAGPGVLCSVAMTGGLSQALYGSIEGFDWNAAFLLGSILSATDPVAVVAVLHTLGAPAKLSHLIEGESLLNDGTAYVVFAIFKELAGGIELTGGEMATTFIQLSVGGPLWGLAMGIAVSHVMRLRAAVGDALTEITVLLCGVYTTFFLAEHYLHVSGVLAVVVFGVFLGKERERIVGHGVGHRNHEFWEMVGFLANALIFAVSGLIIFGLTLTTEIGIASIGALVIMYVSLHLIRGIMVETLRQAGLKQTGYGIDGKEAMVMVYSGLRGAVGLALAMEVEHDSRIAQRVQEIVMLQVGGIVLLTLLVNGTTAGIVYEYINPYPELEYREALTIRTLIQLDIEVRGTASRHVAGTDSGETSVGGLLEHLRESPFHGYADWPTVADILPDVTRLSRVGHVLALDRSHPDVNANVVTSTLVNLEKKVQERRMSERQMSEPLTSNASKAFAKRVSRRTSKIFIQSSKFNTVFPEIHDVEGNMCGGDTTSNTSPHGSFGSADGASLRRNATKLPSLPGSATSSFEAQPALRTSQSSISPPSSPSGAADAADSSPGSSNSASAVFGAVPKLLKIAKKHRSQMKEDPAEIQVKVQAEMRSLIAHLGSKIFHEMSEESGVVSEFEREASPSPLSPLSGLKSLRWAQSAVMETLHSGLNSEVKTTVYDVVLKTLLMRVESMYEENSISAGAYQRLIECFDTGIDAVAALNDSDLDDIVVSNASAAHTGSSHSGQMARTVAELKKRKSSIAQTGMSIHSNQWKQVQKWVTPFKGQQISPFQVAWNALEAATEKDLDHTAKRADDSVFIKISRALLPVREEGLSTSAQSILGFITAIEQTIITIQTPQFSHAFAEDPNSLLNNAAASAAALESASTEPAQGGGQPSAASSGISDSFSSSPMADWLLKQLNVVKIEAYGSLAAMRVMFPSELRVVHTILAANEALTTLKKKLDLISERGLLTHHTLDDIVEVVNQRQRHINSYHLKYLGSY